MEGQKQLGVSKKQLAQKRRPYQNIPFLPCKLQVHTIPLLPGFRGCIAQLRGHGTTLPPLPRWCLGGRAAAARRPGHCPVDQGVQRAPPRAAVSGESRAWVRGSTGGVVGT